MKSYLFGKEEERTCGWFLRCSELGQAGSLPAEKAIDEAKAIQLSNNPDLEKISDIHQQLVRNLASDDDFWPRWTFFAKKHGVKI